MEGSEWLDAVKLIGAAIGALLVGVGGYFSAKRAQKPPAPSIEGDVVAATFTERALMERLIVALGQVCTVVEKSHAATAELVEHLESEKHERELAKAVRDELDRRGRA